MMDLEYEEKPIKRVGELRELISKIEDEVKEKQFILESLNDSLVRSVRSIIIPFALTKNTLREACSQQNEKKKADRPTYEFVKEQILRRFFRGNKDVKLKSIVQVGWEGYTYEFQFEYKGYTFELGIPNIYVAQEKNIYYMNYGMYSLRYEEKPSVWSGIAFSYKGQDIADGFDNFCKEHGIYEGGDEE